MDKIKEQTKIMYLYYVFAIILIYSIMLIIPAVLSGEPWLLIILVTEYSLEFSISLIFLILAAWIGGKKIHNSIIDGKSLLSTAFRSSIFVNSVTLGTFILTAKFNNNDIDGLLFLVILIVFVIFTTLISFILSYIFGVSKKTLQN